MLSAPRSTLFSFCSVILQASRRTVLRYWLPWAAVLGASCSPSQLPVESASQVESRSLEALPHPEEPYAAVSSRLGDEVLMRSELRAYHGWIKYLQFQADHQAERRGKESGAEAEQRLAQWTARILKDPGVLDSLRGVHEWAYESAADGSGQPFRINIPTDYTSDSPAPLAMYMHGYSGNHLEHAQYMVPHEGYFDLSVLGRSRGGGYVALSEADALGALEYVQEHWAIDARRVHLSGGSMGGGGTFWLASRYPHRFASARPVCGFASDKPMGNLLSVPFYATHSDDDYIVPIAHVRGPLARLAAMGGQVVLDETTGLGHAAWDYAEGNARAQQWAFAKQLPESQSVRRLDFTALDGNARRAWWAEVEEWGAQPRPARFVLEAKGDNVLQLQVSNVRRLRLDLARSPVDSSKPLTVQFSTRPLALGAAAPPFPVTSVQTLRVEPEATSASLVLEVLRSPSGEVSLRKQLTPPRSPVRLHTPGGPNQLYNGQPLLIVYGTLGNDEMNRALAAGARAASNSSRANFWASNGDLAEDGVAHNLNLYGQLPVKADREVTAEDLLSNHLVLLGTAAQNSVVRDLAASLPVQFGQQTIEFSDRVSVAAKRRALALTYYNPRAPQRLLYWIASHQPEAYAAGAPITLLAGDGPSGADAVVADAEGPARVVMARSLDSRWKWRSRQLGGGLPSSLAQPQSLAMAQAEAARVASGADYALATWQADGRGRSVGTTAGTTRRSDLEVLQYYVPLQTLQLTGDQLRRVNTQLQGSSQQLRPAVRPETLQSDRVYQVVLGSPQLWGFVASTQFAPSSKDTGMILSEALEQAGRLDESH